MAWNEGWNSVTGFRMNEVGRTMFCGCRNWLFRLFLFVCFWFIVPDGHGVPPSHIVDKAVKKITGVNEDRPSATPTSNDRKEGESRSNEDFSPISHVSSPTRRSIPPFQQSFPPPSNTTTSDDTSPGDAETSSGNALILLLGAFVAVFLIAVVLRSVQRFQNDKCPRCGGPLHSGSCDLCGYPRVPCEKCGMAPVDGVCPECDIHLGLRVRYNEGYLIGKGGFGEVYQAIWSETGTEWVSWHGQAVLKKFLLQDVSSSRDPEALARWKQLRYEADVLTYLQTANTGYPYAPSCRNRDGLVSIRYEATEVSGDEPYFVMDRAPGNNISGYWNKDERRMAQIPGQWSFLLHLAKALNGLRALDVAHRDIKPDNLYWDEKQDRLTLIDFGSARCEKLKSTAGETLKNPVEVVGAVSKQWAAPEHVRYGLSAAGCAADLYSYGLLFCTVLLGSYYGSSREVPRDELERRAGSKLAEFILSQALEPNAQIRGAQLMEKYRSLILALQVRVRWEKNANA